MRLYRRRTHVGHSLAGWHLTVWDRYVPALLAEAVVNGVLACLGHPCCGRGIGRWEPFSGLAFRFLNLPNRLAHRDRELLSLPLTAEQAAAIEPEWVASYLDDHEDA